MSIKKKKKKVEISKRKNKSAPLELPANKQVSRFRSVVRSTQSKSRDPRFGPLSGDYSDVAFDSKFCYNF